MTGTTCKSVKCFYGLNPPTTVSSPHFSGTNELDSLFDRFRRTEKNGRIADSQLEIRSRTYLCFTVANDGDQRGTGFYAKVELAKILT